MPNYFIQGFIQECYNQGITDQSDIEYLSKRASLMAKEANPYALYLGLREAAEEERLLNALKKQHSNTYKNKTDMMGSFIQNTPDSETTLKNNRDYEQGEYPPSVPKTSPKEKGKNKTPSVTEKSFWKQTREVDPMILAGGGALLGGGAGAGLGHLLGYNPYITGIAGTLLGGGLGASLSS